MARRYGIYFAPDAAGPLWQRASAWLGRDAAAGAVAADIPGLPEGRTGLMASAIRYGFHATLKAPMVLGPDVTEAELGARVAALARTLAPVSLGPLQVADLDGFLALVPQGERSGLVDLAARVVTELDDLRAPLSAEDRARRGPLDPRAAELLETWGYPHVLERFQFHMTLTDRVSDEIRPGIRRAAENWFAGLGETVLDRLVIFTEDAPGAAFVRGPEFPFPRDAK